jgi:hypothetical protein
MKTDDQLLDLISGLTRNEYVRLSFLALGQAHDPRTSDAVEHAAFRRLQRMAEHAAESEQADQRHAERRRDRDGVRERLETER